MAGKVARFVVAVLGVIGAIVWSALFLANPRVSLELLVLFAPVIVPVWLITMLTRSGPGPRQALPRRDSDGLQHAEPRAAVLQRDHGVCAVCGRAGASQIAARRPARAGDPDPLARYVSLCPDCAAAAPLASASR